jgi:hypothetical protein
MDKVDKWRFSIDDEKSEDEGMGRESGIINDSGQQGGEMGLDGVR